MQTRIQIFDKKNYILVKKPPKKDLLLRIETIYWYWKQKPNPENPNRQKGESAYEKTTIIFFSQPEPEIGAWHRKNEVFHLDRAPCRDCDHCDPGRDAAAGFEPGTGKRKKYQMPRQHETDRTGFQSVSGRLQRSISPEAAGQYRKQGKLGQADRRELHLS